jgi:hypothetical protein
VSRHDWSPERIVAKLRAAHVQWRISQGRLTETGESELPSSEALLRINITYKL